MSRLKIDVNVDVDGCAIVRPSGPLNALTYGRLRDTLLKCAAEVPVAVIVDLRSVKASTVSALTVFSAVWMRTADWPGVPMLLFGVPVDGEVQLTASQVARFVPVFPHLDAAKESLHRSPEQRPVELGLQLATASTAAARRYVIATCETWHLTAEIADDAATIATEFVENPLLYDTAEALVRLKLRDGMLTIAVSDVDLATAVPSGSPTVDLPSPGLLMAPRLAVAWGCTPTSNGGKVMWAVLRVDTTKNSCRTKKRPPD
ncbi:MAG: hypothetical protein JWQ81_1771 [Amycolatopsis sp.]|jgi:hypothetical protein|uniref:STAS domain-containing protein n=1 Tax=Amycolatopsis sp. TaxID=37632 RepID=UPI002628C7BA|nr:STAS domain-containing protein [Amycolatopsis sp.]MCU1681032.1 hypothetical protein [Amycolatopsis sp.]